MYSVGTWTKNLSSTDSPFTIKKEWGIGQFSLRCTSATAISYRGNKAVGGNASEDISLGQNDTYSFSAGFPVEDFIITLPAGATAELVAQL